MAPGPQYPVTTRMQSLSEAPTTATAPLSVPAIQRSGAPALLTTTKCSATREEKDITIIGIPRSPVLLRFYFNLYNVRSFDGHCDFELLVVLTCSCFCIPAITVAILVQTIQLLMNTDINFFKRAVHKCISLPNSIATPELYSSSSSSIPVCSYPQILSCVPHLLQ